MIEWSGRVSLAADGSRLAAPHSEGLLQEFSKVQPQPQPQPTIERRAKEEFDGQV